MAKKKHKREVKKIVKNEKKGIEMSFEWIFAMLIGGVILFIAIYAVVHLMTTGQEARNTDTAARLEGYLSPYETGQGSGISDEIHFSVQSKLIFEECEANDNKPFGVQSFAFTEKMFGKYGKPSNNIDIKSKYIFANESVEGKDFYIVSVPYFMGYKVSDLILIYSGKYCFIEAPEEIQDNVEYLKLKNINFSDDMNCKGIKVCFDNNIRGCDMQVSGMCFGDCESSYDYGEIVKYDKKGKSISTNSYMGNLLYAGIFSSDNTYECNVKRLMSKFNELGKVYLDKIRIMEIKGCSSNIQIILSGAMQIADGIKNSQGQSSQGLIGLDTQIKDIEKINEAASEGCRLFVNDA